MHTNTSRGHSRALLARLSLLSLLFSLAASRVTADIPLEWNALVPADPLATIDATPQTHAGFIIDPVAAFPQSLPRTQLITRDPEDPALLEQQANLVISIHNLDPSKPGSVIPPTSAAECRWLRSTDLRFWECAPQFPSKKDLAVISYRHHLTYSFAIGNAAGIAEIPDSVLDNWIGVLRAAGFRRIVVQYISGGWGESGEILREWPDPNFLAAIPATLQFLPAALDPPPAPAIPTTAPLQLPSIFPGQTSAAPAPETDADLILDIDLLRVETPWHSSARLYAMRRNYSIRHPRTFLSGNISDLLDLRLRLGAIQFPQRNLAIVVLPPAIRPTQNEIASLIEILREAGFVRISIQRRNESSRLIVLDVR